MTSKLMSQSASPGKTSSTSESSSSSDSSTEDSRVFWSSSMVLLMASLISSVLLISSSSFWISFSVSMSFWFLSISILIFRISSFLCFCSLSHCLESVDSKDSRVSSRVMVAFPLSSFSAGPSWTTTMESSRTISSRLASILEF